MPGDPVLAALENLKANLELNLPVVQHVLASIDRIIERHESGQSWSEIVTTEERPLIVEQLSANLDRLSSAGSRLRRAQAKALHDEGMTMEQIASFFGVTRQRVSALLKERVVNGSKG